MYEIKINWNNASRDKTDDFFLNQNSFISSKLLLVSFLILMNLTLIHSSSLVAQQYNRSLDFRFQVLHHNTESENGIYHELLSPIYFELGIGGRHLYSACYIYDSVSVYDVKKGGMLFNLRTYHNGEVLDGVVQKLDGPKPIVISPNGRYLSVIARETNTLSIYQIDADGLLSHPQTYSHGDFVSDGNGGTIRLELLGLRDSRFHISGEKLFAFTITSNVIIAFDVSSNGLINPNIYRNFVLPDGSGEHIISGRRGFFHPNGKNLYVVERNRIFVLSVSPDLQLSLLKVYSNGESLNGVSQSINLPADGVVNVLYNLLYLADYFNNSLLIYKINSDGLFSEVTVIFFPEYTSNSSVTTLFLSFDNRYLYVVNYGHHWVRIYELNEGIPGQYVQYSDGDPYLTGHYFLLFPISIAFSPDDSITYISSFQELSVYRTTPPEDYDFFSEELTCKNRLERVNGEHFDVLTLIESTNNTINLYGQRQRDRETDLNQYRQQLAIEINTTDSLETNITRDLDDRHDRFEEIIEAFGQAKKVLFAHESELADAQKTQELELIDFKITQNKIENDARSRSNHIIPTLLSILQFSCAPVIFIILH